MQTGKRDSAARNAVLDHYSDRYEFHAEREQLARAEGRVEEENAHHAAIVVLIRALTAEQVPT